MSHRPVRIVLASAAGVALIGGGYVAGAAQSETTAPTAKRAELAVSESVRGAKGRTLRLSRVTVPPGAKLALHHHPGTQISNVEQGTLTYTVKTGQVRVMRGDAADGEPVRTIKAGQTAGIRSGQWIVEQPNVIHRAANRGKTDVVIAIATLFPDDAPLSVADDE
jgi:quercetin dioxygenase-like cupin family protein